MEESLEIAVFDKDRGVLSKTISLVDGEVKSDGSTCRMARGWARRRLLAGVAELATLIEGLKSNQAITLGALRPGLPNEVVIVTKNKLDGVAGAAARTPLVPLSTATDSNSSCKASCSTIASRNSASSSTISILRVFVMAAISGNYPSSPLEMARLLRGRPIGRPLVIDACPVSPCPVRKSYPDVMMVARAVGTYYSRIRRRQWNQRPKKRPKRLRIRVSTTESTIDVTIGK